MLSKNNLVLHCLVLLPLIAVLTFAVPATARAEDGLTIVSTHHDNRFPAQIVFAVDARSSSQITRVNLRYKLAYAQHTTYSNVDFQPGTSVSAEYVWNTQRQYIPPGVELEYYWQLEDAAGHTAQSAPASLKATDTRFPWQSLSGGPLTLSWYKGDRGYAQDLLDAGTKAVRQLSEEVGAQLLRPATILVYETQRDMLGALPPRGVEWVGGEAFSNAGVIVLAVPATSSGRTFGLRTLPHELSHLVVAAATDNPFGGLPHWLDEGLAMYAEGDLEPSYGDALLHAVADGSLLSLRSLNGSFPTDSQQAYLAYAQSYSVVRYLLASYGRDCMSKLLAIARDGATVDDSLRGAYNRDLSTLEAEWRTSIGAKPKSIPANRPAASQSPVAVGWWLAGAVGLVALSGIVVFRRRRVRRT